MPGQEAAPVAAAVPAAASPAGKPAPRGLTAAEARAWLESLDLGEPAAEPAVAAPADMPVVDAAPAPAPEPIVLPPFPAKVLVLGLGDSGLAMARWCVAQGADVTVADTRDEPPQLAA